MSCNRYESMIALATGGDLAAAEAKRLERHLDACDACRRFAVEMEDSQRAVGMLAGAPLDPEILAAVRAGVFREVDRSGRRPGILGFLSVPPRRLALAAGLAVAVGTAFLLRWTAQPPEPPRVEGSVSAPRTIDTPAPRPATPDSQPPAVPRPEATQPAASEPVVAAIRPLARPIPSALPSPTVSKSPPMLAAAAPPPAPAAEIATTASMPEPMVIQWVSDNADVVIYWLVDQPLKTTKETKDEISAV